MRIKRLNAGSDKYGNCSVCSKSVDSTYLATDDKKTVVIFGHRECIYDQDIIDKLIKNKKLRKL